MQKSPIDMKFISWKLQRRKKHLGALLDLVVIEAVILKGLSGYQRSTNAVELSGELIGTLVYTFIFKAER